MELKKIFLVLIVLAASFQICFGQEQRQAFLVDEFGKLCSEEVMARYDGFMVQLGNDPSAAGYFVFYGDEKFEGRNLNFISYLKDIYPNFRKFDKSRLAVLRGENRSQMHIQFWVVPAGANPPTPEKEFIQPKPDKTTLFDKNRADFHKADDGKLEIYSNSFLDYLGCEFSPNVSEFAKTLIDSPELTGYLVIYTKFGKGLKRGNQVSAFAVNDLTRRYKVPRNRLKTIYGGNRENPEIELWFVPKNDKPPTPKPDLKPQK